MPAFHIFSDRTLIEIAQRQPQTPDQFLGVHGVGELKLANYGQQFLDMIRDHAAGAPAPASGNLEIKRVSSTRTEQISELFVGGQTLEQIAAHYKIHAETVIQHLQRFQSSGGTLDPSKVLSESKLEISEQARVFEAFQRIGPERLGEVYHALAGAVPYQELHLLRLYWFCTVPRPDT